MSDKAISGKYEGGTDDLVHAIEHQQWLDSPKENPCTTNRPFKPIPLGHEPFPKIERVEE